MCLGEKKKGKSWTNSRSQLSDGKLSGQGLSPLKTTAIKRRFLMGGLVEIGTMKLIYQTVKNCGFDKSI
jgi:hypothetical protein